jgi:LPS-assembly lipoprotein
MNRNASPRDPSTLPDAANGAARTRRRLVFALGASAVLGACGFQLRGSAQLPFSSLHVVGAGNTPFGQELRRALRSNNVRLEDAPGQAEATLQVLSEIRERLILSLGGQGRVREYSLLYRLAYQVTGKAGVITPPTEILLKRDISFNDNEALAKESEEAMLYRDMQTDAVQQLIRRLQATRIAPA